MEEKKVKKSIDGELEAIKSITTSLRELEHAARIRVLKYVVEHLEMPLDLLRGKPHERESSGLAEADKQTDRASLVRDSSGRDRIVDIRTLKKEKQPRTDSEMAALVAYYLSEHAPEAEKKDEIVPADIEKYFKQASFPLPKGIKDTLPSALRAGYFDRAGHGKYRLNPVGYNLVVHSLPPTKQKKQ